MKNHGIFLLFMLFLFLFGCSRRCLNKSNSYPKLLPVWDGASALYSRVPDDEIPVCIVQFGSPEEGPDYFSLYHPYPAVKSSKAEMSRWRGKSTFESGEWDGLPPRRTLIKVYSEPNEISQMIACLYDPELPEKYVIKPNSVLVVISISSHLHSQTTRLVPFALTKDGFAVTPRGKDKTLYKLLASALKERNAP